MVCLAIYEFDKSFFQVPLHDLYWLYLMHHRLFPCFEVKVPFLSRILAWLKLFLSLSIPELSASDVRYCVYLLQCAIHMNSFIEFVTSTQSGLKKKSNHCDRHCVSVCVSVCCSYASQLQLDFVLSKLVRSCFVHF